MRVLKRKAYAGTVSSTVEKGREVAYFSVGYERHLPRLGGYDLADPILLGDGADGAEVSHWVDEFLSGRIECRHIINFKWPLFLCGLKRAGYTCPHGVHIKFFRHGDGRDAEIGMATGVLVLLGRASRFERRRGWSLLLLFVGMGHDIGHSGSGNARRRSGFGRRLNPRWLLCIPPGHSRGICWSGGHNDGAGRVLVLVFVFYWVCADDRNG